MLLAGLCVKLATGAKPGEPLAGRACRIDEAVAVVPSSAGWAGVDGRTENPTSPTTDPGLKRNTPKE